MVTAGENSYNWVRPTTQNFITNNNTNITNIYSFWNTDNITIYNNSGVISVNESWLNGTIQTLDTNCSVAGSCPNVTYLNYNNTGNLTTDGLCLEGFCKDSWTYEDGITGDSLRGYWSANNNAFDYSGNANNGENFGTYTDGIYGNGFHFNGSTQCVNITDDDSLSFTNGTQDEPYTITTWIRIDDWDDFNGFRLVSKGFINIDAEYVLSIGQYQLKTIQYDTSEANCYIGRESTVDMRDYLGEWVFIAATYNGNETNEGSRLYLNGERIDDIDKEFNPGCYNGMENLGSELTLGRQYVIYSIGAMDETLIYNRELSQEEIRTNYESDREMVSQGAYVLKGEGTYEGDFNITGSLNVELNATINQDLTVSGNITTNCIHDPNSDTEICFEDGTVVTRG